MFPSAIAAVGRAPPAIYAKAGMARSTSSCDSHDIEHERVLKRAFLERVMVSRCTTVTGALPASRPPESTLWPIDRIEAPEQRLEAFEEASRRHS